MTRRGKQDMNAVLTFPKRPIFEGRRKSRQEYAFEFPRVVDKIEGRRLEVVARLGGGGGGPGTVRFQSEPSSPKMAARFEDQRWERRRDGENPQQQQQKQQQHHHHQHHHHRRPQHQQQQPPNDRINNKSANNTRQQVNNSNRDTFSIEPFPQQYHRTDQFHRPNQHTRALHPQRHQPPPTSLRKSPIVDSGAFPPRVESKQSPTHISPTFGQFPQTPDRAKWEDQDLYNRSTRQVSPLMMQRGSPELLQRRGSEDNYIGDSQSSSIHEFVPEQPSRRGTEESIGGGRYEKQDARSNKGHQRVPSRSGSNMYQNASPKGLRIRTHVNTKQPPARGRTMPDPSDTGQNGHGRKGSNGNATIIQMPLAFSSIAKTRAVNTTATPSISLPDLKAHTSRPTGRRPSILKDEIQKQSNDSNSPIQRNYSPNLGELQHIQNYYSRQHTPSPPNIRSRDRTPSPSNLSHSPNDMKSSFRTALQNSRIHRYQNEHSEEQRSSVVTADSALTSSTLEAGEMSVEDAIGMYESDEEDHDPTQNPVIDPQPRTGNGIPVHSRTRSYDMERKRSPSRMNEYKPDASHDVELQNMTENGFDISPVRLVLNTDLLEAELQEAQNTPQINISTELFASEAPSRMSLVAHDMPTTTVATIPELRDPKSPQDSYSVPDIPPKNPPVDPSGTEPRDRYGFRKKSQFITLEEYNAWYNGYEETLIRRQKKWQLLLKESGLQPGDGGPTRFPPRSQKVKRFVRKGIPPEWRGAAWFWYAGGRTHLSKHPGLYDKLVDTAPPLDSEAPELIERDLHRTFPDNIHFKPEQPTTQVTKRHSKRHSSIKVIETPMVKSLRRVLLAFALYVPRIGYCQSLNFWAGMLLLFMDEEKAFWMLYIITHQYLPGTHDTSLEGSNIDQGVLMMSVRESVPQVWQKISIGLDGSPITLTNTKLPDITLCTASWLMSGFISNLPIETVLRVWDSFFYEGSKILFRISLALFKAAEVPIRNLSDPIDVFQVIQTTPRKFIDAGALMDLCFKRRNGYGHLSQQQIDDRRKERRTVIEREAKRRATNEGDNESAPRGSKDDMVLRKMFVAVGGLDDATSRFKKYYKKR